MSEQTKGGRVRQDRAVVSQTFRGQLTIDGGARLTTYVRDSVCGGLNANPRAAEGNRLWWRDMS